ncbi:MAG: glycosyltransferase family 2 protein [Candidatus Dormibacteria bacterium]
MIEVAVVIPSWNGRPLLSPCLASLALQSHAPFHTIVVDNGSTDGTAAWLAREHPHVDVIRLDTNRGFAGGVNAGIRRAMDAGATFVALLNNDAVADPHWLAELVRAAAENPRAAIVAAKMLLADGVHIDSTGELLSSWGMPYPRGRGETDRGQYDTATEVFAGSGGASLYRTAALRQTGLFDEGFFAYLEDVDMGFRARLCGWEVCYAPAAVVRHRRGATSASRRGFTYEHTLRNLTLLHVKNTPLGVGIGMLPRFGAEWCLIAGSGLRRGQIAPFARAVIGTARLLPAALRQRRRIQRRRCVPAAQVRRWLTPGIPPGQAEAVAATLRMGARPQR